MADVRIKYRVDKGELVLARKELDKINKELGVTQRESNQASGALKKVGGAIAVAFTVDRLVAFGRQVISVTAEFQKLRAVLTNTLGSRSAADQAFQNIQKFAANTPFQVNQITDSFVKLANQGFVPTTGELTRLGDLVASTGKEFDQLTEAIIDAQVGEFERLKEFGIRASKEGDNVTFTFKGVQQQVDFTAESIQDYILSLGELEGVSGSMAAISETLGGKLSNLQDGIDSLFFEIGTKLNPAIGGAIDVMGSLISTITDFIGTPFVEQLRLQQTELNVLVGAITDVNTSEEARSKLITELNSKYPDFLKNLDAEKATNEQIVARMKDVNEQFLRKIALAQAEQRLAGIQNDILDTIDKEAEARKEIIRLKESDIAYSGIRILAEEQKISESLAERSELQQQATEQLKSYTDALDLFNSESNDYFKQTEANTDATEQNIESIGGLEKSYISLINTMRMARQQLNEIGGQSEATLEDIENFILEQEELISEKEQRDIEREQRELERYEQNEQLKRDIARETADIRLSTEQAVVGGIIDLTKTLGSEFKDAAAGFILIEKGLAIADIIISLQREIAGIAAANASLGAVGIPFTAAQITAAKIRAGIGIAAVGAQALTQAFADGVINLQGGVKGKDSVPALLMPGESVMTTEETRNFLPTFKAIRENKVDPEVLNAIATGKSGGIQVHNSVVEVPRDTMVFDEDGFSVYMHRKNITTVKKTRRYKC